MMRNKDEYLLNVKIDGQVVSSNVLLLAVAG